MRLLIAILALGALSACGACKQSAVLPEGNMPMTAQEDKEAQILLLEEQRLPHAEYRWRRDQIMRR
ncbi:hypothetical protein CYD26_21220 [Pseudomonas sp. FFUP_PS_473]|nr:hypothetical protein CYD26_21220 [Pseudomonas sp. FFUP_PS_473]